MRIAIAGFLHESHSFAAHATTWQDFLAPGGWPPLQRPGGLVHHLRHTAVPAAGAIAAAEAAGATLVPLTWAFANPAGPVTDDAFERICALIITDLEAVGPLDGLYLDLHGAMVTDAFPDAEGELLRRIRAVVGDLPIAASLDPHGNLTAAMVRRADVLTPFRTYPHVDMKEAGARAIALLLARINHGKPFARAFRQLDFWIPLPAMCTLVPPMADAMGARAGLAEGVAELGLCFGFPYADFPDCGASVFAYAETQAAADAAADGLLGWLRDHETGFVLDVMPAAIGVAEAMLGQGPGPVVLADTQDNPGGGGHGDTTGVLAALVAQGADAVLALINDDQAAAACHAAGAGARLALTLGGRSDGVPFVGTARVLLLSDGRFTCTGPMTGGNPADLGPSALIAFDRVRVIVTSRKMQAYDQAIFRHLGVEPAAEKILVLKSSVHFRADFQAMAARVIIVTAPGPVVADPSILPFRHLRPGLRLKPRTA